MSQPNFQVKAQAAFYQIVGLGLVFLALLTLISFKLYPTLVLLGRSFNSTFEVICGCSTNLSFTNNPLLTGGLIILGAVIVLLAVYLAIQLIQLAIKTQRFVGGYTALGKKHLTPKLERVVSRLGLTGRVVEVASDQPVIFCFGFFRPRICIASSLANRLQKKELLATLRHEQYHLHRLEPLKLLLLTVMKRMLFFVPGIKKFSQHYSQLSEMAADQFATDNFTNKGPLARALYKILALKEETAVKNGLALSFFSLVTEQRINQLTGQGFIADFSAPRSNFSFTIFAVFCLSLLLGLVALFNVPAQAGEGGGRCQQNQSLASTQCALIEIPSCNAVYQSQNSWCSR